MQLRRDAGGFIPAAPPPGGEGEGTSLLGGCAVGSGGSGRVPSSLLALLALLALLYGRRRRRC
jgi:MYXO-CTERM domain-containing protein